ncbi:MAG: RNA polymerase Rpb4 [Candidatus Bathyarchaeota archaeon]|nr:RNA polymerase Rpb4 [Candidatus Bathyarchaeota archaeon]MDH5418783.1 RNA polymerase Rpb4 [Candidatus Bathyarchaeota archaeon]MDH5623736.1 RNA polymerase Rpb4 [Candidatus Bathyarchaeota archaeon]MDH5636366.1 RNA polymerase Rpb4 [Candidatus Bathyarchaeota archaeon]MDH5701195.1 RNA polymerase Rpb4 [Candidatus Bathyarchaeota archaeon]
MSRKALKERPITIPQVKETLEAVGEERLDQFQRRSLDYAAKFSKVDPSMAETLVNKLVEQFELEEEEAVQITNCMPESIQEIRVFLASGRRIMETSKLKRMLAFLDEYRKRE